MDSCLAQVTSINLRSVLCSTLVLRLHSDLHVFVMIVGSLAVLSLLLQPVWTAWSGGSWVWRRTLEKAAATAVVLGLVSASSAGLFCLAYQGVRKQAEGWVGWFTMLYPLVGDERPIMFPTGNQKQGKKEITWC